MHRTTGRTGTTGTTDTTGEPEATVGSVREREEITRAIVLMQADRERGFEALAEAAHEVVRALAAEQLRRRFGPGGTPLTAEPTEIAHAAIIRLGHQRHDIRNRRHLMALAQRFVHHEVCSRIRHRLRQRRDANRRVSLERVAEDRPAQARSEPDAIPPMMLHHASVKHPIPPMMPHHASMKHAIPPVKLHHASVKHAIPPVMLHHASVKHAIPSVKLHHASMKHAIPSVKLHHASMKHAIPPVKLHHASVKHAIPPVTRARPSCAPSRPARTTLRDRSHRRSRPRQGRCVVPPASGSPRRP